MQVVIGSGPVGGTLAALLAAQGERVRLITRSGSGPEHPAVERVALDASDREALRAATTGATVIYNAANPSSYATWPRVWPPLAGSILAAAEAHGATLGIVGNLYAYGPVDGPMTEDLPLAATDVKGRLRAQMWEDALASHEAGRIRAVEVRAGDYIGAGGTSHVGRAADLLARGRRVTVIGSLDQPHTWTSSRDTARTLATLAADPAAHGRAWHVPSNAPRTQREVITELAAAAGLPEPKVAAVPHAIVTAIGLFVPEMREVARMSYQFERPFVLDDGATRARFGLAPTPWEDLLAEVVAATPVPTGAARG